MKKLLSIGILFLLTSCGEEEHFVPKPRGYIRVDYPDARNYVRHSDACGFSADIPDHAVMVSKKESDTICFRDLELRMFNATLYLTYVQVNENLHQLLEESRQLLIKHQIKATDIIDSVMIDRTRQVYGTIHTLSGNVASNIQFTITDSTRHFLRGSLHFYATPNYDSLYPMIRYIEGDVHHMINTLQWAE